MIFDVLKQLFETFAFPGMTAVQQLIEDDAYAPDIAF